MVKKGEKVKTAAILKEIRKAIREANANMLQEGFNVTEEENKKAEEYLAGNVTFEEMVEEIVKNATNR